MRSLWRGSLSFGLVNVPVRMYTGSHEKELSFVMLHKKDMSQIKYARICKAEGKEVPWDEIVKGYEYKKGDYIVLTDEDFKKAGMKKTDSIDIVNFTDESEIESIYYDKAYLLEPDKGASKAYALLREALSKSGKVGIATFIMHNHERFGVIKPFRNALILNQLRYQSEIVNPKNLELPADTKIPPKELDMAIKLIDQLTEHFKPEKFHDDYVENLMKVIESKAKGRKIVHKEEAEHKPSGKVHDIMSLLKASLEKPAKKGRKHVA